MADEALTTVRWHQRWWVRIVAIFLASRVVTTIILLVYASIDSQQEGGPGQNYWDFATNWDGRWYWLVSSVGYPTELPRDDDGYVTENAWAFMPAFPALVKIVSLGGRLPFPIVAPLVAAAFALGAALVFYKLMCRVLPERTALFSVVLLLSAPLSAVLQVSYAESMHLFLLLVALHILLERRYSLLIPVVLLMSMTRPSGLAFALLMLLHGVYRFVVRRRDPFPVGERISVLVAGAVSLVGGLAWPVIAWLVTGSITAYTDTELAWRVGYIGHGHLLPFASWFQGATWWLGWWHVPPPWNGILGAIGVGCLVVAFAAFLLTPLARRLGVDIRFWLVSYALYLLAVFFPQSSTFRLFVPFAPALGALAIPRSPVYRAALVLAGIAGQVVWVHIAWWVDGRDWTPP